MKKREYSEAYKAKLVKGMRKTSKYKSLSEWKKEDPEAHQAAIEQKLITKICQTFGWKLPKEFREKMTIDFKKIEHEK